MSGWTYVVDTGEPPGADLGLLFTGDVEEDPANRRAGHESVLARWHGLSDSEHDERVAEIEARRARLAQAIVASAQ